MNEADRRIWLAHIDHLLEEHGWSQDDGDWSLHEEEDPEKSVIYMDTGPDDRRLGTLEELCDISEEAFIARITEIRIDFDDLHDQLTACRTEYDDLQTRITHALTIITRRLGHIQEMPSLIAESCTYQDLIDILEGKEE